MHNVCKWLPQALRGNGLWGRLGAGISGLHRVKIQGAIEKIGMAGFKAHFVTAAAVGGLVGTHLLQEQLLEPQGVLAGFFLAILGGLLPDVDADNSTLLALAMTVAAMIVSFLVMFSQSDRFDAVQLVSLWLGCYLFFKWAVFGVVTRLTTHRGIFHSIPAAVLGGLLAVLLLHRLFGWHIRSAWLGGGFVWLGYMVHLILDEVTSLNMFGFRGIRHSLGSALKFRSPDLFPTLGVYFAILLSVPLLPDSAGLWDYLSSVVAWQGMGW
ncbi:MAG: hypothetical protein HW380_3544 [Magnetococcales bacterium]|nr:hypothetical protein [Magnetococcales bacterium]